MVNAADLKSAGILSLIGSIPISPMKKLSLALTQKPNANPEWFSELVNSVVPTIERKRDTLFPMESVYDFILKS